MRRAEIVAVRDDVGIPPGGMIDIWNEAWQRAPLLTIDQNWQGDPAPVELGTTVRLLWNDHGLALKYECAYTELDVDDDFDPGVERHALWDRDVCEAFIRSPIEPHEKSYREFEVAPTGQWCDLLIDRARMWHDWEWRSGMRTAAEIDREAMVWRVVMSIPFEAFGVTPKPGDIWLANLFRISRLRGERQYLAFSPTGTEVPSFHVAEAFVDLAFVTAQ